MKVHEAPSHLAPVFELIDQMVKKYPEPSQEAEASAFLKSPEARATLKAVGKDHLDEAIAFLERGLAEDQSEHRSSADRLEVLKAAHAWMHMPVRLERAEHSAVHKLLEAYDAGKLLDAGPGQPMAQRMLAAEVFLVRHDWYSVLQSAVHEANNDIVLPYPSTLFEFVISGRRVILWAVQRDAGQPQSIPFIQFGDYWMVPSKDDCFDGGPLHHAWLQASAICIALDSEVATHEVIRAPGALNRKREKAGRPLLRDHHIVDLSKRHRAAASCPTTGTHRSPRLHFRRGHWRHYEGHKTWIRWQLVGNPDLGFVDKDYRI